MDWFALGAQGIDYVFIKLYSFETFSQLKDFTLAIKLN